MDKSQILEFLRNADGPKTALQTLKGIGITRPRKTEIVLLEQIADDPETGIFRHTSSRNALTYWHKSPEEFAAGKILDALRKNSRMTHIQLRNKAGRYSNYLAGALRYLQENGEIHPIKIRSKNYYIIDSARSEDLLDYQEKEVLKRWVQRLIQVGRNPPIYEDILAYMDGVSSQASEGEPISIQKLKELYLADKVLSVVEIEKTWERYKAEDQSANLSQFQKSLTAFADQGEIEIQNHFNPSIIENDTREILFEYDGGTAHTYKLLT